MTPKNKLSNCECEHIAHFPEEKRKTPNGNPGHRYGQKFFEETMVNKGTEHGKFLVCKDCANDCLALIKE